MNVKLTKCFTPHPKKYYFKKTKIYYNIFSPKKIMKEYSSNRMRNSTTLKLFTPLLLKKLTLLLTNYLHKNKKKHKSTSLNLYSKYSLKKILIFKSLKTIYSKHLFKSSQMINKKNYHLISYLKDLIIW